MLLRRPVGPGSSDPGRRAGPHSKTRCCCGVLWGRGLQTPADGRSCENSQLRMAELLPLSEAIARFVRSGDSVALEGFTHLIPFAAGHEIIRQQLTDLTLIRMTPDLIYD